MNLLKIIQFFMKMEALGALIIKTDETFMYVEIKEDSVFNERSAMRLLKVDIANLLDLRLKVKYNKKQKEEEKAKNNIFTDEFLKESGYTVTKRERSKFGDKHIYGEAKDRTGMSIINWNESGHSCTYFGAPLESNVSFMLSKDGGTRTAFNGYVYNQEEVKTILRLTS